MQINYLENSKKILIFQAIFISYYLYISIKKQPINNISFLITTYICIAKYFFIISISVNL